MTDPAPHPRGSTRVAIVTGGGSGIGRALADGLVRRGVHVVVADLDGDRAADVAEALGGPATASSAGVDVRDADAVAALVHGTYREHGRLDLLFNNAGITVGGEVDELSVDHWDRAIDVNLRGVINGVAAAYPLMVEQGGGHIVNTASMSGLLPTPGVVPYATTKFGVVGLSLSLRAEAASRGVRVTVVCPGAVETPILDSKGPADLPVPPSMAAIDTREIARRTIGAPVPADELAEVVLAAVARNVAIVVHPRRIRLFWWAFRLAPDLVLRLAARQVDRNRR